MSEKIIAMYINDEKGTTQLQVGKNPVTLGTFSNVVQEFTVKDILLDEYGEKCTVKYDEVDELETVICLDGLNYNYLKSTDIKKYNDILSVYEELKNHKEETGSSEVITK